MMTTGLYNASGIYSAKIGIPTKSGVGGGLVSSVPNKAGIGIFSPPLDDVGNSYCWPESARRCKQGI